MCIYKESVIYYLYFGYIYNISEVDISAADISVVDISVADISVANISVADISGIDISVADISVVDFQLKFVQIYTWLFANDDSALATFYRMKIFVSGRSGFKSRWGRSLFFGL